MLGNLVAVEETGLIGYSIQCRCLHKSFETDVDASVTISVTFTSLSVKYCKHQSSAVRSIFGDLSWTSRLSTVTVWRIKFSVFSIKEYVQYFAHLPGKSHLPSPDNKTSCSYDTHT